MFFLRAKSKSDRYDVKKQKYLDILEVSEAKLPKEQRRFGFKESSPTVRFVLLNGDLIDLQVEVKYHKI